MEPDVKKCIDCNEYEYATLEFFHKRSASKDGLNGRCKECTVEVARKKYLRNKKNILKSTNQYKKDNKKKILEQAKVYNEKHKERIKAYRNENKEHFKQVKKEWDKDNADYIVEYRAKHYEENKEAYKQRRQDNQERYNMYEQNRRARKKMLPNNFTVEQWEEVKVVFDSKCAYCGSDGNLEQDHFIPLNSKGGYTIGNIIPACRSCNARKHDKDFSDWYPTTHFFCRDRQSFITDYLKEKQSD